MSDTLTACSTANVTFTAPNNAPCFFRWSNVNVTPDFLPMLHRSKISVSKFKAFVGDFLMKENYIFADLEADCVVRGAVQPLLTVDNLCGRHRGIQGHQNSCYLDATLFAMFTYSW